MEGHLDILAHERDRQRHPAGEGVGHRQRTHGRRKRGERRDLDGLHEDGADEGVRADAAVFHDAQDLGTSPAAAKAVHRVGEAVLMEAPCAHGAMHACGSCGARRFA